MRFDIVSLFPEMFGSYFSESILGRAQQSGSVEIVLHHLRDYAKGKHRVTDDTPYGGGAGMVMMVEPLVLAVEDILHQGHAIRPLVILMSAKGKQYTQQHAVQFAERHDQIILLCGRYEGVDERVMSIVHEELRVGPYVLTGGELPAMILVDSITRLLPGVVGNADSIIRESFSERDVLEYPQYTKPEEFRGLRVPDVLLSGHHAQIEEWRRSQQKKA